MEENRSEIKPRFRRVLLKLSGEALMGSQSYGVDPAMASRIAEEISELHSIGVQVAATVGGGNIVRGNLRQRSGDGSSKRRLHGHAGDGYQRPGAAKCT